VRLGGGITARGAVWVENLANRRYVASAFLNPDVGGWRAPWRSSRAGAAGGGERGAGGGAGECSMMLLIGGLHRYKMRSAEGNG
jgi:hypothetical protein